MDTDDLCVIEDTNVLCANQTIFFKKIFVWLEFHNLLFVEKSHKDSAHFVSSVHITF